MLADVFRSDLVVLLVAARGDATIPVVRTTGTSRNRIHPTITVLFRPQFVAFAATAAFGQTRVAERCGRDERLASSQETLLVIPVLVIAGEGSPTCRSLPACG